MARQSYRGSLTATKLPFRVQDFGRTVINPGYDAAFSRQLGDESGEEVDSNLPQVYYAENVLPTRGGYKSIGQTLTNSPNLAGALVESLVFKITEPNTNKTVYFFSANDGARTIWIFQDGAWFSRANPSTVDVPHGGILQNVFILNGLIHLSFGTAAASANAATVWTYATATTAFTAHPLTGSPHAGFAAYHFAVAGFLCSQFFTNTAWSSNTNIYDFTPSLLTGAGSLNVQDLESWPAPVLVLGGAILVGSERCVAMVAANNARYPFTFQTITGSVGAKRGTGTGAFAASPKFIGWAADSSGCYTISDTNVQKLTLNTCQSIFPEVIDFFDSNVLETVDLNTYGIVRAAGDIVGPLLIRTLLGRYVVIVYQQTIPALFAMYGLVFDTQLQRTGRIKFLHDVHDVIEWEDQLAYVTPQGQVYKIDDSPGAVHIGALFIGKFQHVRNSLLTLQGVSFEGVQTTDNFTVTDLPTLDGNTFLAPQGLYANPPSQTIRKYDCRIPGVNHTLVCRGKFDLNVIEIDYVVEGIR